MDRGEREVLFLRSMVMVCLCGRVTGLTMVRRTL